MTTLDERTYNKVLDLCRSKQKDYSLKVSRRKKEAKRRAADILGAYIISGDVIDLGGESYYKSMFKEKGINLTQVNLPDDIHDIKAENEYDGALAMHVLEHSPFPMYLLEVIRTAVKPGGYVYIAVPYPRDKWLKHEGHFTPLHPIAWKKILLDMGFEVCMSEKGPFGSKSDESRVLCRI